MHVFERPSFTYHLREWLFKCFQVKEKYRGMFEIQKFGKLDKFLKDLYYHLEHMQVQNGTGPDIQQSKRLLLACNTRCEFGKNVQFGMKVEFGQNSWDSVMSDRWRVSLDNLWSCRRMPFSIHSRTWDKKIPPEEGFLLFLSATARACLVPRVAVWYRLSGTPFCSFTSVTMTSQRKAQRFPRRQTVPVTLKRTLLACFSLKCIFQRRTRKIIKSQC